MTSGPTYGVMNAPSGVNWRSAPDWNTPESAAVYNGTVIQITCYETGAANVPGTADDMWEEASWYSGSGGGSGWINEHFINDGQKIDQPSPGVPPCNAGSNGGTPEVAGGNANTWTNYLNAGGTQGPEIGGYSTIYAKCRLQGFQVADGNTWWYQVASPPWDDTFYVSADAFYNNGQTSGSLVGTPFVDTGVPLCSAPSSGVSETTGGTANTWTNPSDAGGSQGPTIPAGATVSITCKLSGFQVADGNTWWYEVGSAPWSNGYYVSADAFYNNGSTSGSLRGTPFVDYAVPDCGAGSTGSNPGGARGLVEYTGPGGGNTWTNYTDAGGVSGGTIAAGTAVTVTCRVQGFRVADGNTWWYRVASPPWAEYFVSADPFYNNGSSSGTLAGTPFYDPAVPVCTGSQEALLYATSVATGHASGHSPTCTYGAYPVNCASGDFWHSFTDVSVPGRGPGLDLVRTYNSLSPGTQGLFGFGWTSTYDQHLLLDSSGRAGDGSVVVVLADGSEITATPNGGGGYTTPANTDSSFQSNADGTYTLTLRHLTLEKFSSSGQLLSISDLNGNATTLAYSGSGQLSAITDASGRTLSVVIGSNGLVSSVSDPMGRATSYQYDSAGDLTSVTDPLGRSWSYAYDGNHRMLTMTDPRGGAVANTYNGDGEIATQTDPAGLTTLFAYTGDNYGPNGGTTTITDPHGSARLEIYDNGFLMEVTKALGTPEQATTSYTYDPTSYAETSATDPDGRTTSHGYDSSGDLLSTTDATGATTSYTYNPLGEVLTATTPLGETTTDTYDSDGNLLTSTDPLGDETTYSYADSGNPGQVTAITDPDGRLTSMTYDRYGDLVSRTVSPTSGTHDTTAFSYDLDGEQVCKASANATAAGVVCPSAGQSGASDTTSTTYDADGEAVSVTDPDGHTTTYTYNGDGDQTSVTDAAGNETTKTYDLDNRVTAVTTGANAAGSSTITTAFDLPAGRGACPSGGAASYCTTSTNGNGETTVDVYDAADDEVETIRPGDQTTASTFDLAGDKLTTTQPDGTTMTYGYDADNRVMSIGYSDATPSVAYTYNADGERETMTDGTGTTTYNYDAAGRLASETNGAGATVSYAYDGAGDVRTLTYPNGQVTRTYNGADWLASVTDWLGNTTSFGYDHDGDLTTTSYPDGDVVRTAYDAADNETGTGAYSGTHALATIGYQRTAADLISQEKDTGAITGTLADQYNAKDQLTTEGHAVLAYDADGNLTKNGSGSQDFNSADELTSATTPTQTTKYSYDANGNRASAAPSFGRVVHDKFDANNDLTAVSETAATPSVTGVSPGSASQAGGNVVTINGSGFTEATGVQFGNASATGVKVLSDTQLTAIAPAHTPSTVDVTVTGAGGSSAAVAADQYSYTSVPGISAIAPTAGLTTGGGTLTITGAGFTGATSVAIGSKHPSFTVVSDTSITLTVPPGTGAAKVSIKTPAGTSSSITNPTYNYASGPFISSLSATSGPTSGGNTIALHGAGFSGATAVKFGSTPASSFTVESDTVIEAVVPAGSFTQHVSVTTETGTSPDTVADHYSYPARPSVQAIAPLSGPSTGGNTVTITGTAFTTTTRAYFGRSPAVTRYISSSTLLAIAPTGSDVQDVTVEGPGGTSPTTAADRYSFAPAATSYGYNGDGLRMNEALAGGGTTSFTWDTTTSVPGILNDGTNSYIYGPGGEVLEQIDGSGTPSYYFHDAIGSTRALLAGNGSVAGAFTYSPYGVLLARTGSVRTPFQFAGGYFDESGQLYYLVHRDYDAVTGQFVSIDPVVGLTNQAYAYVGGDPANATDPSGEFCFSWSCVTHTVTRVTSGVQAVADVVAIVAFPVAPEISALAGGVSEIAGDINLVATCSSGREEVECAAEIDAYYATDGLGTSLPDDAQGLWAGSSDGTQRVLNSATPQRTVPTVSRLGTVAPSRIPTRC